MGSFTGSAFFFESGAQLIKSNTLSAERKENSLPVCIYHRRIQPISNPKGPENVLTLS